jgi:hypothetical protein
MSEDVEVSFALPRRPYWQSAGFAVGCAERLLPMAAGLGGHRIAETTEPGLALAWKAAAGLGGRSEIERAIAALTDAIHHAADDGLEVLGADAANVTVFALEAVSGSTRAGWVSLARAGTLGLVRGVGRVAGVLGEVVEGELADHGRHLAELVVPLVPGLVGGPHGGCWNTNGPRGRVPRTMN